MSTGSIIFLKICFISKNNKKIVLHRHITVREGTADGINEKDLKSPVLTGVSGNIISYITKGIKAIGHIIITQIKSR